MPSVSQPAAVPPAATASLAQAIVIVILWNTGFKGARVACTLFGAVGSVFGLSPVFLLSSAILAAGGYAGRPRGAPVRN